MKELIESKSKEEDYRNSIDDKIKTNHYGIIVSKPSDRNSNQIENERRTNNESNN